MSSNLVENFFGAINTISQANVDAAKRDETIDAEIASIVNVETGEYKVTYQGNTFSAYAADPTTTYQKGDKVYVLVPRGDYSARKVILGNSAFQNTTSQADLSDLTNFYIIKGPNWLDWYKGKDSLDICAVEDKYKSSLTTNEEGQQAYYQNFGFEREIPTERPAYICHPTSFLTDEELAEADEQITRYSAVYDSIMISANFQTRFSSIHSKGQYMLRVQCITDNPLYITDPSHPDYKDSRGEEWLKLEKELADYNATVDENRYQTDAEYQAEVNAIREDYRGRMNNVSLQKPYKITNFDLGFKQFSGAPYNFIASTPQKGYFTTKNAIKGLYAISLYQDGQLVADIIPTYFPDGTVSYDTQNSVLDTNNILCENIDIRFCQRVNLTETLYYPWIETPYGDSLYDANSIEGRPSGRGSVQLIAHLQHGLQDLIKSSPESIEIYWFRQKSDVTSATPIEEERDAHGNTWFDYGGPGWYPIEKLIEEGGQPPQDMTEDQIETAVANGWQGYDIDFNILTIRKEAVPFKWIYKAVIVYRDMSKNEQPEINRSEVEQEIIRLDSPYNLKIEQFTSKDGRKTYLRILDQNKSVHEINPVTGQNWPEWFGTWWLELQDGSYTRISDPYWHGPLEINDFLLNDIATFYVQCYDPEQVDPGNTGIATGQFGEITTLKIDIISASPEEGSLLCDWIGRDTFNYDALGIIKDWAADKDNTLEPEISWAEGVASDYVITIIGPDGVTPLSNREYYDETQNADNESGKTGQCATSMMKNMWVDFENTIHFQVENQYDPEKTDNTFTVRVQTVNGVDYEFRKTVFFTKDGDMGTIGAEWSAQIKPCNWKYSLDNVEGAYLEALDYPAPLIIYQEFDPEVGATVWKQDKNFRTFLRPFVKKNGVPLEQMDPFEGYFYKVYWDVRMPSSFVDPDGKYAAFLRLYHADGTMNAENPGALYTRENTFYETGGMNNHVAYDVDEASPMDTNYMSKVNDLDKAKGTDAGLVGFSLYPSRQYGAEDSRFNFENYGAVEVRFFDNAAYGTGVTMQGMLYRFIVKAQVDIMKGQYDQGTKMIQVEGNVERINSITSYYPIDILINGDGINFSDPNDTNYFEVVKKIATNWPQYVAYNATGYDPAVFPDPMYFKYGPHGAKEEKNYEVFNLTPLTQTIETLLDIKTQKYNQYYRAKAHLNFSEGFWGTLSLQDDFENKETPWGPNSNYIRNQILYLNAYGNVDINGWDGQGIDMNEENGTIFATTVGAGYKRPSTNAFTGVLMGADRSQKRSEIPGYGMAYDQEANEHMPYMTGLFGYQDGVKSFALMENGTAFFGRADRGGRIIIDGANATIYGGGNGVMDSPAIGDPMWNTMRLTLSDLQHTTSGNSTNVTGYWTTEEEYQEGEDDPDHNKRPDENIPIYTGIQNGDYGYMTQGFDGKYFGYNYGTEAIDRNKLPYWYRYIWEKAYIKPDGVPPYWLTTHGEPPTPYSKLPLYVDNPNTEDSSTCFQVDYWWGKNGEKLTFQRIPSQDHSDDLVDSNPADLNSNQLSGFAPSRASTTPAIEVGQHIHGLMPGLIDWCEYQNVFTTLNIPGDRNFMVTYDGTLWAMNGVFLGVIIGSNIVGGRIQGAEIGIGHWPNPDGESYVTQHYDYNTGEYVNNGNRECHYEILEAPWDYLHPINENGTPGKCENGQGVAFYVDQNGNVIANSIRIYGGSIDIGRFHIMGGSLDDPNYGHLIQLAESDFIGPTHFYGNIAIGPALNIEEGKVQLPESWRNKQNAGNLFQTKGYVGLGIPLPEGDDPRVHYTAVGGNILLEGPSEYEAAQTSPGDPQIGQHSLEQTAFFGIDTFSYNLPEEGSSEDDRLQGHFWPLHFHYGYSSDTSKVGSTQKTDDVINAYATVMNIFKSKSFTIDQGVTGGLLDGSNYWRVGPYGMEGMIWWIKKKFQDEQKSIKPDATAYHAHDDENIYLGYFGMANRAGGGTSSQASIGITSWYAAPVIVQSDGESAWNTRGHFHMFTKGWGGNADDGEHTWEIDGISNYKGNFGIVFNQGSNMGTVRNGGNVNKAYFRLGNGHWGVAIEDGDNTVVNTWDMPSPHRDTDYAGILIDPQGHTVGQDKSGAYMWTRKGSIHLIRQKEGSIAHYGDTNHVELWLSEDSLRGVAVNAISLCLEKDAHKAVDSNTTNCFGLDKKNIGIHHETHIGITVGNAGTYVPNTQGFDVTKGKVMMGDGSGYIRGQGGHIYFEGSWATEDFQHNIYARFA